MAHKKFNLKPCFKKFSHNFDQFINDKWTLVCILDGVITNYAFDAAMNIYDASTRYRTLLWAIKDTGHLDLSQGKFDKLLSACEVAPVQRFIFAVFLALAIYSIIMLIVGARHLLRSNDRKRRGLKWPEASIHWWNLF